MGPISRIAFACLVAACRIGFDELDEATPDGGDGAVCVGDVLHAAGAETTCAWGCVAAGGPHCGGVHPAGGVLAASDLALHAGQGDLTLTDVTIIDGDAGTFTNGPTGHVGQVAVFHVESLLVAAPITVIGSRPVAIVADQPLIVSNAITVRQCDPSLPVPGGYLHGVAATPLQGQPGGSGYMDGAGGGANGGNGGRGVSAGGGIATAPDVFALVGGGGGGDASVAGGNGGGALQLVSNTRIEIAGNGTIDVRGCDGQTGYNNGGGGAGGTILLAAPTIVVDGVLLVDGGRGGNAGGAGGAGNAPDGVSVVLGTIEGFGGGGGGIGRVLFETRPSALAIAPTAGVAPLPNASVTTIAHAAIVE